MLPPEIKSVAKTLRGNADRLRILRQMAGADDDPRSFIESQKTILLDVLIPVLYEAPTMSLQELRMLYRQEAQTAYLSAVALDDKYQSLIVELAQEFLPTFQGNIDGASRKINNSAEMQGNLLGEYIDRIASKDMAERIIEAKESMRQAMTVLENTTVLPGEVRGASHMAPFFDETIGAAKKTRPNQRVIKAIGKLAEETVDKMFKESDSAKEVVTETIHATESAKATLELAATSDQPLDEAPDQGKKLESDTADKANEQEPSQSSSFTTESDENEATDGISADVKSMVSAFVESSPERQRKELIAAVRNEVQSDKKIVDKAEEAIRLYHGILNMVYQRYKENQDKRSFVGKVERMTLANLLLSNQESLNLGQVSSNLYPLLLDAVESMDPEDPDPQDFIPRLFINSLF